MKNILKIFVITVLYCILNPSYSLAEELSLKFNKAKLQGNTIFQEEIKEEVQKYLDKDLGQQELLKLKTNILELYKNSGYINSQVNIIVNDQESRRNISSSTILSINIIEGYLEEIIVSGNKNLDSSYIKSRILNNSTKITNTKDILEALQLLRINPLIKNISATIYPSIAPGSNILEIKVEEQNNFELITEINNTKSPSIGSFGRNITFKNNNVFGFGDKFNISYLNTNGSDNLEFGYKFPINAKDGNIGFRYNNSNNNIIENPFSPLDIETNSDYYELSYLQPIVVKPLHLFSLGLNLSHQNSQSQILGENFPLSRGANENGITKISKLQFSQEYLNRNDKQIFALRSQFNFGLNILDATNNSDRPSSNFFSWQGQSQWVRRFDNNFLILLRGNVQLSDRALVPLEQFRLGGGDSIRGYRQDLILGDNGFFASAEIKVPLFDIGNGKFYLAPFTDIGTIWNNDEIKPIEDFLASIGLGFNLNIGNLDARLDWGIPLIEVKNSGNSLQENGVTFSLINRF